MKSKTNITNFNEREKQMKEILYGTATGTMLFACFLMGTLARYLNSLMQ